jgi:hypothetical protein
MKIVGCDLHARQQSIAMVGSETGEFTEKLLKHEGNVGHQNAVGVKNQAIGNKGCSAQFYLTEGLN